MGHKVAFHIGWGFKHRSGATTPARADSILMEDAGYVLTEDGDAIPMETT